VSQGHGVLRDLAFHGLAHLGRSPEEAVCRHAARDPLVRPLEVIGLDEKSDPPLAVRKVRKHRARQKLVPQRLPETLDLSARLRVVGTALDVPYALAPEFLLEFRAPPPGRVLPPLVGEDLLRCPILRDTSVQGLHDQRRLLVVGHHQRNQIARVVVHEGRHIEPFMAAQ
jgi:hypothetical protein